MPQTDRKILPTRPTTAWTPDPRYPGYERRLNEGYLETRPIQALPDGAEVLRASGEARCSACGQRLDVHPKYAYPWQGYCHKLCNGTFVHC